MPAEQGDRAGFLAAEGSLSAEGALPAEGSLRAGSTRQAEGSTPAETSAPIESAPQFVETRSGRVAFTERGPRGNETERPLLLVHGYTGHRDDFLPVLEPLAQSRRVLVPDLRGHGHSESVPGPLGWTFEQLVKDLEAFLEARDVSEFDLLGHSMGGFVALRFALAHPARVRSLTFLCTGPETPATLPREGFEKAAAIAAGRGIVGLQAILEKVGRADCSPTIAAWGERYWLHHRRRFAAMTAESYAGIGRAFFDSEPLVDRLPELNQPTLILVGEFDHDWLPGAALFLQNLPDARRVILKNAEHHPHQENTADFLHELEAHLAVASSRTGGSPKSPPVA